MRNEKVCELSLERFQPFGSFAPMINPDGAKLGAPPIEFYRDMLSLKVGTPTASFSVCRVEKRPMVVDVTEFHSWCGEGILPLDGISSSTLVRLRPKEKSL